MARVLPTNFPNYLHFLTLARMPPRRLPKINNERANSKQSEFGEWGNLLALKQTMHGDSSRTCLPARMPGPVAPLETNVSKHTLPSIHQLPLRAHTANPWNWVT